MKIFTSGLLLSFLAAPLFAQNNQDWPAVSPQDLSLKNLEGRPGAPAVMLEYREVTDFQKGTSTHFSRIKILNENGLKYATIELTYTPKTYEVQEIRARTISPEGTSTPFTGEIHDTTVVKQHKTSMHAKTFAVAGVSVGTIIDYSYRYKWEEGIQNRYTLATMTPSANYGCTSSLAGEWQVQRELFLKHGEFSVVGAKGTVLQWYKVAMKDSDSPTIQMDGGVSLEVRDVPPYEEEEFSPPEDMIRSSLKLFYVDAKDCSGNMFWGYFAQRSLNFFDAYLANGKSISKEVGRIVSPADPPDVKLRKIYARVQQIRPLSAEPSKTEKQEKREHLKPNENAQAVLDHGYGYANEINLLFIAMVRAAGMQAYPMQITTRDRGVFVKAYLNTLQLNSMVVEVLVGEKSVFLDPGRAFCPFEKLPWEKTGATGLRYGNGNSALVPTSDPAIEDSITTRSGELVLDTEGNLKGTLEIAYGIQDSMNLKWRAYGEDETTHTQMLESGVSAILPAGAKVRMLGATGWTNSEEPLHAKFEIELDGYATSAGKRWLLQSGILHTKDQNPFTAETRTHPIYFDYPYEVNESLTVVLPSGYAVESVPAPAGVEFTVSSYSQSTEQTQSKVTIKRKIRIKGIAYNAVSYPSLRKFFGLIHDQDEQPIALKTQQ